MKRAAVPSILVAVVLLALGVIAEAQQPKKVPRIGYLSSGDPASESARSEGVRLSLRELGYIGWVQAVKNTTKRIPIVMVGVGGDPVKAGLVESLARPGGNVTGITNLGTELGGKRLELFKEAVPKIARVAVLYDPAIPRSVIEVKEVLPVAARALRLTIQPWEVRAADDFEKVFAALSKQRPDGLYVPRRGPANEC